MDATTPPLSKPLSSKLGTGVRGFGSTQPSRKVCVLSCLGSAVGVGEVFAVRTKGLDVRLDFLLFVRSEGIADSDLCAIQR